MGIEVIAVIGDAVGTEARPGAWRKRPTIVTREIGLIVRSSCGRDAGYWLTVQRFDTGVECGRAYRWIEVQGLASDAELRWQEDRCFHRIRGVAAPIGKTVGALVAHVGDRQRECRRQGLLDARIPCIEGRKTERVGSGARVDQCTRIR